MANTTTKPNAPDSNAKSNRSENNAERERATHDEHRSHHLITHWIAQLLRILFY